MGCDIHITYEHRKSSDVPWVASRKDLDDFRNYEAFGLLAGVRGELLRPIALPRGVPTDCSPEYSEKAALWGLDGHSHSWLTLQELESVVWSHVVTIKRVVTDRDNYSGSGRPASFCGWSSDPTAREVSWDEPTSELCGYVFHQILPYLREIGPHSRMVFFFDN